MVQRIEGALQEEMADVREEVSNQDASVVNLEESRHTITSRLTALEESCATYCHHFNFILLCLEDVENQSWRKNLRVRGLPKTTTGVDLKPTVQAVCNTLHKPP